MNKYSKKEFKQLWECHLDDIVRIGKSKYKVVVSDKNKFQNALMNIYNNKIVNKNIFTCVEVVQ
jgi:hypothetical protein